MLRLYDLGRAPVGGARIAIRRYVPGLVLVLPVELRSFASGSGWLWPSIRPDSVSVPTCRAPATARLAGISDRSTAFTYCTQRCCSPGDTGGEVGEEGSYGRRIEAWVPGMVKHPCCHLRGHGDKSLGACRFVRAQEMASPSRGRISGSAGVPRRAYEVSVLLQPAVTTDVVT